MKSITQAVQLSFDTPHLCECGCGEPAPIAKRSYSHTGAIKGHPQHFICGHKRDTNPPKDPIKRFWSKVDKTSTPDGCWPWLGPLDTCGYGMIKISRRTFKAHRVAYELAYGPIPEGLEICHHCDFPGCVRADHLFAGTHMENMLDRDAKGRGKVRTPLTSAQVAQIREQRALGLTYEAIGSLFNLSGGTVNDIVKGKYGWDRF